MDISGPIAPTVVEHAQPPQRVPPAASGEGGTRVISTVPSPPAAAATEVSEHAQALNALQTLSVTDPAKFKQEASDYADALKAQAAQTGGDQAAHLTRLAQKFDEAAQSGSPAVLHPPAAPAGSVQAAYAGSSPQASLPPMAGHHAYGRGRHGKGVPSDAAPVSNAMRYTPPQA